MRWAPTSPLPLPLLLLFLLLAAGGPGPATGGSTPCDRAEAFGRPTCQHGGQLVRDGLRNATSCSRCECPEGWAGADCGLCASREACVAELGTERADCSVGIWPLASEFNRTAGRGKLMSCSCGGDPISDAECALQPETYILVRMEEEEALGDGEAGGRTYTVRASEQAGVPDLEGDMFKYASPLVWDANFTGCVASRGPCEAPLKGEACLAIECSDGEVQCPPEGVEKCPDWTPFTCGWYNSTNQFWELKCLPVSTPFNAGISISCQAEKEDSGEHKCYFFQKTSPFGQGIGAMCRAGTCVEGAAPPEPPPPDREHGWVFSQVWVSILFGTTIGAFIAASGLYAHVQSRKWRYEPGAAGPGPAGASLYNSLGLSDSASHHRRVTADLARGWMPHTSQKALLMQWRVDSYTIHSRRRKRVILHRIHGEAGSASVVGSQGSGGLKSPESGLHALLGPSGAGKTTLLDILAGRSMVGKVTGEVFVDGQRVEPVVMRRLSGYVMQDDVLPGTSTVWEYMLFHANLRMPKHYSALERKQRAHEVIEQLGLGKVAHSFIGDDFWRGLSKGEKRRVSVGAELVTRPSVLFLDEPTTGLSTQSAKQVVDILAALGELRVTVVLSIHQPSTPIFNLMERLLLLSPDGKMVYSGPSDAAIDFFAAAGHPIKSTSGLNVADHLLDFAIKQEASTVAGIVNVFNEIVKYDNRYLEAFPEHNRRLCKNLELKEVSSKWTQFQELSVRMLRKTYRHPWHVALNALSTFLVSLLLGAAYWQLDDETDGMQNRLGCMFVMVFYLSLMSLSSLPALREQWTLFLREAASNIYSVGPYFASMALFDLLPLRVFPPCFFGFTSYWMIGLRKGCASCLALFMFVLIACNVASTMMCLAVGAVTKTNRAAIYVCSVLILLFTLFGSFIVNKAHEDANALLALVSKASFFHYGYDLLVVNEFHGVGNKFHFTSAVPGLPTILVNGDGVLHQFGFRTDGQGAQAAALVALCGVLAAATLGMMALSSSQTDYGRYLSFQLMEAANRACWWRAPPAYDPERVDSFSGDLTEPLMPPHLRVMSNQRIADPVFRKVLTWQDISASVERMVGDFETASIRHTETAILQSVSGYAGWSAADAHSSVRASPLLGGAGLACLLGPSGAGKTTLLDILAGRSTVGKVTGDVCLNGQRVEPVVMRRLSGYVMQDDVLPGTSTVWEYMLFHANLRMPKHYSALERKQRAHEVIEQLGLGKVAHSFIGDVTRRGISGGEKKRVSIGTELVATPFILFLDEPTTGLDSTNAAKVVDLLGELNDGGVTVALSIQQPRADVVRLVGNLVVLTEKGQMLYSGPADGVCDYFNQLESVSVKRPLRPDGNCADDLIAIMATTSEADLDAMVDEFACRAKLFTAAGSFDSVDSDLTGDVFDDASTISLIDKLSGSNVKASAWLQLQTLGRRACLNVVRQPFLLFVHFLSTVLVSVALGFIFRGTGKDTAGIQSRLGTFFFILLYMSVASLSSLPVWRDEQLLFRREKGAGCYGSGSYFVSVVLLDFIPMRVVPPCVFAFSYKMIGLQDSSPSHLAVFLFVLILTNCTITSATMAIGALSPSNQLANVVASVFVLNSVVFGGFVLNKTSIPGYCAGLAHLSPLFYAFEALLLNEFEGEEGYKFNSEVDPKLFKMVTGDQLLQTFGYTLGNFWLDVGALAGMCSTCLAVSLAALARR